MIQDLWQRPESVGLSQVSRNFSSLQISARYSSSKVSFTHLRPFRPDQGPHTVVEVASNSSGRLNH